MMLVNRARIVKMLHGRCEMLQPSEHHELRRKERAVVVANRRHRKECDVVSAQVCLQKSLCKEAFKW